MKPKLVANGLSPEKPTNESINASDVLWPSGMVNVMNEVKQSGVLALRRVGQLVRQIERTGYIFRKTDKF